MIKYWQRILKNKDSLIFKLYDMRDNSGQMINEWALNIRSLISDLGFNFLWDVQEITDLQMNYVIERIYDQFLQQWFSDIQMSSKLDTYCFIKSTFVEEKYLTHINNDKHRIALSRLRCSSHRLAIEEGRYRNIARENRLCTKCNMNVIETEYHFVLVCPFYNELRRQCLGNYYCQWPSKQKFKRLMNATQKGVLTKLSKFVYLATERRNQIIREL